MFLLPPSEPYGPFPHTLRGKGCDIYDRGFTLGGRGYRLYIYDDLTGGGDSAVLRCDSEDGTAAGLSRICGRGDDGSIGMESAVACN